MSNVLCIKCRLPIFHGTSHRCPSDEELQMQRADLVRETKKNVPQPVDEGPARCICPHCVEFVAHEGELCEMCHTLGHSPELDNLEAELLGEPGRLGKMLPICACRHCGRIVTQLGHWCALCLKLDHPGNPKWSFHPVPAYNPIPQTETPND